MCVCVNFMFNDKCPIRHMHAFKNMAQLPHARQSIAEKGQKDSIHCRIHKTAPGRENFWFSSWSISPLKAELYNLCWTAAMPEERLKLPNLKYDWGVSQRITVGCFSHLTPVENNRGTTYLLRQFYAVNLVKCTAEDSLAACAASATHWTIKMRGDRAWTSPGATQEVPAADCGVPTPAILRVPRVLPVRASLTPPRCLCPCVPDTWVCEHETSTQARSLSLCCPSTPWPLTGRDGLFWIQRLRVLPLHTSCPEPPSAPTSLSCWMPLSDLASAFFHVSQSKIF